MFQDHRIISASEAATRVFEHNVVVAWPPVRTIRVVLPGDERVFFNPNTKTAQQALGEYQSDTARWFARAAAHREVCSSPDHSHAVHSQRHVL